MRSPTLERPNRPRHTQPIAEQAQQAGYLYRLRGLSGLDCYEREMVSRMLARGVKSAGDRRCLQAMAQKHLAGVRR